MTRFGRPAPGDSPSPTTRLYAANQHADTIAPFTLDPTTGALTPTGDILPTPTPACLVFEVP